ncbi:MAG: bifunctional UDP-N-acetylglucosamine diphosphorylase/glucosamine-1-phosphate N-acetyltransferase GlmU [Brockia lithotrophica]|nr:bifunctional UDP-N-acetylglucosamine diphosphorylase/glucosamine-1-phosphate N-acetyltransferase GlmU [Brockia lithotrophica]
MERTAAIVLAAGRGTRMKSRTPKVLHCLLGKPMLTYVVEALRGAGFSEIYVVVGEAGEEVRRALGPSVSYVEQGEPLGTGHATAKALEVLPERIEHVFVVNGDMPLLTAEALRELRDVHARTRAAATIAATYLEEPRGYGRIVRSPDGSFLRIVEEKDATPEEREIREVNAGLYAFAVEPLRRAVPRLRRENAQGEYYLPDVLPLFASEGLPVSVVVLPPAVVAGVNDRYELARAEETLRRAILERHMRAGVTVEMPDTVLVGPDVVLEEDVVLRAGTRLFGRTVVRRGAEIGPQTELTDVEVWEEARVLYTVAEGASIGPRATVGPFARLRPGTALGPGVKVGNFVEVKNSRIGEGSKLPHLSYVGDAFVGRDVNIASGVITVNYDGLRKYETVIEDGAFVGCNVNLVAPVRVGKRAYIAAGSTITEDVPAGALAIARSRQVVKEGYVPTLFAKREKLVAPPQDPRPADPRPDEGGASIPGADSRPS